MLKPGEHLTLFCMTLNVYDDITSGGLALSVYCMDDLILTTSCGLFLIWLAVLGLNEGSVSLVILTDNAKAEFLCQLVILLLVP